MKTLLATTAFVLTARLALPGAPHAQERATEAAPFAQTAMPGDLMTRELMGRDVYARPDDVEPVTDVTVEDAENAPDFDPSEVSDRIGTRERLEAEDIVD